MSTLLNAIKETSEKFENVSGDVVSDLAKDLNYIKKSSALVSDALQKGADIMQLATGDIVVTEMKTVTYKYVWNNKKGRFERANYGHRTPRPRKKLPLAKADNAN